MSPTSEQAAEPAAPAPERGERALLLLALVLGLVRFARLSGPSLWFDEVATWTDAHHGLAAGQITNPLGYGLIAAAARLLGPAPAELGLRIVPAVAGWLTIPFTFFAFRRAAGGRAAAFAALLVATSAWHVGWSQTARFYTLAQLAGLGAAWLWLGALRAGKLLPLVGAALLLALGAGFHPTALLLAPAFVAAPFLARLVGLPLPSRARGPALALGLLALLGGLLLAGWARETWTYYGAQKGAGAALASLAHTLKATGFHVTPLLAAAAAAGAYLAWRRREPWLFLAALVSATVLAAALAAALFVRVAAQYVFVVLPWVALAAAAPLASSLACSAEERAEPARGRLPSVALAYGLVLVLASLANVGLYLTVRRGERPPWREAFALVESERGPHDLVLAMEASAAQHYLDPARTWLREVEDVAWFDLFRSRRHEQWTQHARRTWIVLNPEQLEGWEPSEAEALRRFLREECRLAAVYPLYVESRDLSVWVWTR